MATRILRWRAAFAVAMALVIGGWWLFTGGPAYVIQIDYQWLGGFADSAQVVIDGEVVGILEFRPNRPPVRGFEVEKGTHVVELHVDGCDARPDTVVVDVSRLEVLMADMDDGFRCRILFR